MTEPIKGPAKNPCGTCPYRKDVPPGVWHPSEYHKLPEFDGPTFEQPMNVFMCHQQNGHLCAGWVGCHDMNESLGVRMFVRTEELFNQVMDYVSPVPLWESGAAAAQHGLQEVTPKSQKAIEKLIAKRARTQEET